MLVALERALVRRWCAWGLRPEPLLVHGFAVWSYSGRRGEAAAARGRRATTIMSAYATHPTSAAQLLGSTASRWWRGPRTRPVAVGRTVSARYERRGSRARPPSTRTTTRAPPDSGALRGGARDGEHPPYASERAFEDLWTGPEPPEAARSSPARRAAVVRRSPPTTAARGRRADRRDGTRARDRGTPLRACLLGSGAAARGPIGAGSPRSSSSARRRDRLGPPTTAPTSPPPTSSRSPREPSRAARWPSARRARARAGGGRERGRRDGGGRHRRRERAAGAAGRTPSARGALVRLGDEPGLRARIAAGGREVFERRFSADAFASGLREIYVGHGLEPLD